MDYPNDAKLHFLDYWRVVRVRIGLIFLVFLLVVITAGVTTYLAPREYKSFVTIEVEPNMTPVRIFASDQPVETNPDDPKFTQTQFEIITRKGILYPVIDELHLDQRWAVKGQPIPKEVAYNKLKGMMQLQAIRNTNLIEIDVYSVDPKEAALLANTVAEVYMNERVAEQQNQITKGLDQLRDEVKLKEASVARAFDEASKLRTQSGIIDPNPDSLDNSSRVEDSSVLSNQEKVNDTLSRVAELRSKVEQLDRLKGEDLMRAAGLLNLNDPIIAQKLPLYQSNQQEKARLLSSGLGHNHPDVKAAQAQIEVLAGQLKDQIDSVRKGLVTQLAIAESALQQEQANLSNSRTSQQNMKTASSQYLDAKYKYIQERKLLETAKTRLNSETMERMMPQKPAYIRDPAEPAMLPSRPKVVLNMLLGVAAGLILGVGMAFFLEYLDTSVKTMEDVEKFLELPVLAVIPKEINLLVVAGEDTPDAEAYRILKTNLEINRKKLRASTISILSGGASEGKSTTACNLATTIAAGGQRVLVVDADLRRPSQHRLFGLDNRIGLGTYLRGKISLEEAIQSTASPQIQVLTSGPPSSEAIALLNSDRMHQLVESVKQKFDLILFDCPPLLGVSDSSIVTSMMDASIIVVQHRRFPRSMLLRVKKAVDSIGTPLLGVVLNNVDVRHDENYQYYTSYNNYYSGAKSAKKSPSRMATKPAEAESASDDAY